MGWGLVASLMVCNAFLLESIELHPYHVQSIGFNFPSLMAARIMLGVFEAAFSPVITLYFCE
jgi:hypothetical protein